MERQHFHTLLDRLREPARWIQVLVGPRQVGKSTVAQQLAATFGPAAVYSSADARTSAGPAWVETEWARARHLADDHGHALLVLDEVQKVGDWSAHVKRFWDEDRAAKRDVRALLLGSSALLVGRGLSESLAGRFERTWMGHWSWTEMRDAFDVPLDDFVRFGGYPGAAPLVDQPLRWRQYVLDAIVEPAISRDVLQMTRVDKPALLRALFELACAYSSRELSYQKMLGQLHDAGNTTTLAHYLELLHAAGLVRGLQKSASQVARRRGSSPKLLALDVGLVTAMQHWEAIDPQVEPARWGQLVETAVGAHLDEASARGQLELFYWREGPHEVDYVARRGDRILGIEVKSSLRTPRPEGLGAFTRRFPGARSLMVGSTGVPLGEFLAVPAERWLA